MIPDNFRKHGDPPYSVAVVHGGPGAPGEIAPVAHELAAHFGVLEPFQTARTIDEQAEELRACIETAGAPPAVIIGWSWGAWLALITAAKFPALVSKLILVGSGPFEESYAEEIMPTRLSRLSSKQEARFEELLLSLGAPGNENTQPLMTELMALLSATDSFNPDPSAPAEPIQFQPDIYARIWLEASKLRKSGKLLEYARRLQCPVTAIHGDYDPHPGEGVEAPLSKIIKNLKYISIKNCGHTPWIEKEARAPFFKTLKKEIVPTSWGQAEILE